MGRAVAVAVEERAGTGRAAAGRTAPAGPGEQRRRLGLDLREARLRRGEAPARRREPVREGGEARGEADASRARRARPRPGR
jgi:hypothetical protein